MSNLIQQNRPSLNLSINSEPSSATAAGDEKQSTNFVKIKGVIKLIIRDHS